MGRLNGRVCIVTGAARGIGRGIARTFAREGATVVVSDIIKDEGEQVAAEISDLGGTSLFVHSDMAVKTDVQALVDATRNTYGRLDVLVNCAIALAPHALFEDKTRAMHKYVLGVGLYGTLWSMQAAFPIMQEQQYGRIINFDSMACINGQHHTADYNSTKGAIAALTRSGAAEWGRHGITCNLLAPASLSMGADKLLAAFPEMEEQVVKAAPLGRIGDPESDIAPAALFLASDDARYVNGQTLYVDGGFFLLSRGAMFALSSADQIEDWSSRPFNVQA